MSNSNLSSNELLLSSLSDHQVIRIDGSVQWMTNLTDQVILAQPDTFEINGSLALDDLQHKLAEFLQVEAGASFIQQELKRWLQQGRRLYVIVNCDDACSEALTYLLGLPSICDETGPAVTIILMSTPAIVSALKSSAPLASKLDGYYQEEMESNFLSVGANKPTIAVSALTIVCLSAAVWYWFDGKQGTSAPVSIVNMTADLQVKNKDLMIALPTQNEKVAINSKEAEQTEILLADTKTEVVTLEQSVIKPKLAPVPGKSSESSLDKKLSLGLAQTQDSPLNKKTDDLPRKKEGPISDTKTRLLMGVEQPSGDLLPSDLLALSPDQKHIIFVDTRLSRLFLFENLHGRPKLIKDYDVSYGRGGAGKKVEGDLKTPLGVYFTTSRLEGENLPTRYGAAALPINYPNAWDKRLGRTGSGIWLHGSPFETYNRSQKASKGSIYLTQQDFLELDNQINYLNTPVLVGDNISWVNRADWLEQNKRFSNLVKSWALDWESLDHKRYIENYSQNYDDGKRNYSQYSSYKKRVNGSKKFVDVDLQNLSIYRYPDNPNLLVATFEQNYKSNNLSGSSIKRQYWTFDQGRWRIAYEGKPSKGRP